jgi:hypothetical protein
VATAAPAATPDAPATTSPLPAAALPSPDQEPRAPVPWIQDARSARLFVARERASGGVDVARLREAAATIGARFGRPFVDDPVVRRLFSAEAWYVPIAGWTPDLLSTDAREALTVLGRELTQRGSSLP